MVLESFRELPGDLRGVLRIARSTKRSKGCFRGLRGLPRGLSGASRGLGGFQITSRGSLRHFRWF